MKNTIIALVILLVIVLGHCYLNLHVLSVDNTPFCADAEDCFRDALLLRDQVEVSTVRPPLFAILTQPLLLFVGSLQDDVVLINTFFLILLILATFALGAYFFSILVGLLAALIVSSYPIIFGCSRIYMPDLALCAFVAISFIFLLRSNGFTRFFYSVLWAITCACGLLIKPDFVVHIVGPVTWYVFLGKYEKFEVKMFLFSLLLMLALAGMWYIPNMHSFLNFYATFQNLCIPKIGFFTFDFSQVINYLNTLIRYQIYSIHFFLFLGACAIIAWKGKVKKSAFCIVWCLSAYLILELFFKHNIRYTMPYLASIAILTAYGYTLIEREVVKFISICVVAIVSVWTIIFFTFSSNAVIFYPHIQRFIVENKTDFVPHMGLVQPNPTGQGE